VTRLYAPSTSLERSLFRVDALLSYQPAAGTMVFAGWSSVMTEPDGLRFGSARRTNDGCFLKVSYFFRL
jgi:hypothetical protein